MSRSLNDNLRLDRLHRIHTSDTAHCVMVGGSIKREFGVPFFPILHACTEDLGRDWFSRGTEEFDPPSPFGDTKSDCLTPGHTV